MKKMHTLKKLTSLLILLFIPINIYWADESPTMSEKTWYELYKERMMFCSEYKKNDATSETIYLINDEDSYVNLDENFTNIWNDIKQAKEQYRKNMDWIYDCATSLVNLRALKLVKNELTSKSPKLSSRLNWKLDQQINQVEQKINNNQNKCKITSEKNDNIIKKSVLKQTTYEYCRYSFYLEYLKEYNEIIKNLDPTFLSNWANSIPIASIIQIENQKKNEINQEINDIIKTYPIAFKAYSEYENNLVVHILLELLREDFIALREELHKTLNPINQVVYKIANAMRK
jgi:RNAse (barnase) inhibitor barstar